MSCFFCFLIPSHPLFFAVLQTLLSCFLDVFSHLFHFTLLSLLPPTRLHSSLSSALPRRKCARRSLTGQTEHFSSESETLVMQTMGERPDETYEMAAKGTFVQYMEKANQAN
ncbi:uncharacterized [Tachysurus ichikawai]